MWESEKVGARRAVDDSLAPQRIERLSFVGC